MKIYSLTGKSGTGKSYQAMNLCKKLKIDGIIDDGLFVYKNQVIAGVSAKREKTKIGAIKAAVFTREEHRRTVAESIEKMAPRSLLILGTSDGMTDKIASQLGLHGVDRYIHIEDIVSPEQIDIARAQRYGQGKHVIPVPTVQLKRDFAGYFMDPLKIFKSGFGFHESEKTVVRPTYSYLGEFFISDSAISDIVRCVAMKSEGIKEVVKVYENTEADAFGVTVTIAVKCSPNMIKNVEDFQRAIAEGIENMTAFNVVQVNVGIRTVV